MKNEMDQPELGDMRNTFAAIAREVERTRQKFPQWPDQPLHALAILGEEYGELTKAVLQRTYEFDRVSFEEIREEAIQTAAMAVRFCLSLDRYNYQQSNQHFQADPKLKVPCAACDRGDFQLGHADDCPMRDGHEFKECASELPKGEAVASEGRKYNGEHSNTPTKTA